MFTQCENRKTGEEEKSVCPSATFYSSSSSSSFSSSSFSSSSRFLSSVQTSSDSPPSLHLFIQKGLAIFARYLPGKTHEENVGDFHPFSSEEGLATVVLYCSAADKQAIRLREMEEEEEEEEEENWRKKVTKEFSPSPCHIKINSLGLALLFFVLHVL